MLFSARREDAINVWSIGISAGGTVSSLPEDYYELDDFQVRTPTDVIGQHIHLVKFDVTSSDGAGNGYNYEAAEVARCLRSGLLESDTMPLDETLSIMQTMDQLRAEWGLKYPME